MSRWQAQADYGDGSGWHDVGPAMKHRLLVEANADGYREQAKAKGADVEFRIIDLDLVAEILTDAGARSGGTGTGGTVDGEHEPAPEAEVTTAYGAQAEESIAEALLDALLRTAGNVEPERIGTEALPGFARRLRRLAQAMDDEAERRRG